MIKVSVLASLSPEQYVTVTALWNLAGVGNPARGDSYEAVCHTLSNGARIVIVYYEALPVGTVWLTHDFRRLYIHHMAVHPNYRNQGFGHRLMEEALEVAKELKLQAKLEVHRNNREACKLYTDFGFSPLDGYHVMIKRDN
jgi:[ribosomal protein S18]-alanine N-acetyltransferase